MDPVDINGKKQKPQMDFIPYRWQKDCLDCWIRAGYIGITDVVTGAGKTGLAMMAIRKLREALDVPLHVFVVVPTCTLQDQWIKELHRFFPEESRVGRAGGGFACNETDIFQVYIINTARSLLPARRDRIFAAGEAVLLIADECHHYGALENRKIFLGIKPGTGHYYTLGLSSTPESVWLQEVLIPGLGPVIYRYSHTAALSDRIVSPFCIQHVAVSFSADELERYVQLSDRITALHGKLMHEHPALKDLDSVSFFKRLGELESEEDPTVLTYNYLLRRRREIAGLADSRLQCAVDLIAQVSSRSRIIMFCERIEQTDRLYRNVLCRYPGQISKVHSEQDAVINRSEIRKFREGETRILITCRALDEGVDIPSADLAVVLSGSTVHRQRIQRLGRIIRKGNKGKNAVLYYLYIHESSDENSYLNFDADRIPCIYYRYLPCDHTFYCPEFEQLLDSLLVKMEKKGATKEQRTEITRIAIHGMMRADWQRPPDFCAQLQKEEPDRENYWRVMKWLAKERKERMLRLK